MVLVDDERRVVDANPAFLRLIGRRRSDVVDQHIFRFVAGGPQASSDEWAATIATRRFSGATELEVAGGGTVAVQWGAETEVVTGRRLVLFVVLSTSRWGMRRRRRSPTGSARSLAWSPMDTADPRLPTSCT
jgi:PAS domain S-box-containing protein